MSGWLVNDCLTCIPGTKTFWHDLLEWFPDLTFIGGPYVGLADKVERIPEEPDYIIRNASYFRPLNVKCPVISLLQDYASGSFLREWQLAVAAKSTVVFNSPYIASRYPEIDGRVIPLGTDFDFFRPLPEIREDVLSDSILWVGSGTNHPKGYDRLLEVIKSTQYNFCLVMKDGTQFNHPRVRVFNRVGHVQLREIINSCRMLLCTSTVETLHLAGVEAMACNLPVVAPNVGIYHGWDDGSWGAKLKGHQSIRSVMRNLDSFTPREYALSKGLDKRSCRKAWDSVVYHLKEGEDDA
jgi:glycosyltransferase involved in cell wall biosynthesis